MGRSWQLPSPGLVTLAAVAVEGDLALDADVAGDEVDDLVASSAGEDEEQQERPIPPAGDGVGDDREEPPDLLGVEPAGDRLDGLRRLEGIARVRRCYLLRIKNL